MVQSLDNLDDGLVLVADGSLHHIENVIHGQELQLVYVLVVFGELGAEVSADVELPHGVDTPNVLIGGMQLDKVRVLKNLKSHPLVLRMLLLLLRIQLIPVNIFNGIHQQHIIIGHKNRVIDFFEMEVAWGLSKERHESVSKLV